MSREQSLRGGAALIFLVYAVVFFFRAFSSSGFEIGVATLNGVTTQQLDGMNSAIMAYIRHLRSHRRVHCGDRDRRRRLGLVRRLPRLLVGIDNGRHRAGRGIGGSVATALDGALQL
jgi:hypothetical protein